MSLLSALVLIKCEFVALCVFGESNGPGQTIFSVTRFPRRKDLQSNHDELALFFERGWWVRNENPQRDLTWCFRFPACEL